MSTSTDHGGAVLSAVLFGDGSLKALEYARARLEPAHFEDRAQRVLFILACRFADQAGGIISREAVGDYLREKDPGTALAYQVHYDTLAAGCPSGPGFKHAVAQLLELRAAEGTGAAFNQGMQILRQGTRGERGEEIRGHAAARAHVLAALAEVERASGLAVTPEGNVHREGDEVLEAYVRARELRLRGESPGVQLGLDELDEYLGGPRPPGALDLVVSWTSRGKAQPLDSRVLTPAGFVSMGTLRAGDEVTDPDGSRSVVTGVFPQGVLPVYRLTFSDRSSCEASGDHLWEVERWRGFGVTPPGGRTVQHSRRERVTLTTDQLQEHLAAGYKRRPRLVAMRPVQFRGRGRLPLDPYLLGLLLGDGSFTSGTVKFFSADQELVEAVRAALPASDRLSSTPGTGGRLDQHRVIKAERRRPHHQRSATCQALSGLGLYGHRAQDKFVPPSYKMADPLARLAVLQGLMDTDGHRSRERAAEFGSASRQLRDDVVWLARSLGLHATCSEKDTASGRPCYRAFIRETAETRVFRLPRKLDRLLSRDSRTLVSVEYVRDAECQCIAVSAPSRLYVTDDFIPTHNTSLCVQFAWHASVVQGKNVAYFTTETLRDQVRCKLAARHSRLPQFGLRDGINDLDIRAGRLDEGGERALQAVLADWKTGGYGRCNVIQLPDYATVGWIDSRLTAIRRRYPVDLVIVDYLQLLVPERASRDSRLHEDQSGIVKSAKTRIAVKHEVPVISPWQVNRTGRAGLKVNGGGYELEDMSQTSEAANTPDLILSLIDREEDHSGGRRAPLEIGVPKNRGGPKGKRFLLEVDYATCFFRARHEADPSVLDELGD